MHDYRTPEGTYQVSDDRTRAVLEVDGTWVCYYAKMLPCGKYYFKEAFGIDSREQYESWINGDGALTSITVP